MRRSVHRLHGRHAGHELGCVRDWPRVQTLGVPVWTRGFTPNYFSHGTLYPWAYNVPTLCSRVLVLPGDIIADDDGAVVVPQRLAPTVLELTLAYEAWEKCSRMPLAEDVSLRTYNPLSDEGYGAYEAWQKETGGVI